MERMYLAILREEIKFEAISDFQKSISSLLSLNLREVQAEVYVTPDTASLVSSLDLSPLREGLDQAQTSIAAFRTVLGSESNMINETKVEAERLSEN